MENTPEQEHIESHARSLHNRETASEDSFVIENSPPFFDYLKPFLSVPIDAVVHESRKYEKQYLAWQSVRHAPGGKHLTGFEGYFLGSTADTIKNRLTDIGLHSLRSLYKDPALKQEVLNTLTEKKISLKALYWLNGQLGSITARLRAEALQNPHVADLRYTLYERIGNTSQISYKLRQDRTLQTYRIPKVSLPAEVTAAIIPESDSDTDPLHYLGLLGKAGHPLFRAGLRNLNR